MTTFIIIVRISGKVIAIQKQNIFDNKTKQKKMCNH